MTFQPHFNMMEASLKPISNFSIENEVNNILNAVCDVKMFKIHTHKKNLPAIWMMSNCLWMVDLVK